MKETLKVGVIGVGIQGETHIRCYQSLHNAEVVAVADLNEQRAKKIAEQYRIPNWYTDPRSMLELSDIDAISVVTPDPSHRGPAIAAIDAGKHVLIEKPLATKVEDAEAILNAARKAGVKLMVNFSNRWKAPVALVKQSQQKGELGDPVYAYARLSDTIYVPTKMISSWSAETSLPFWLMSHTVDLVRWLFNSEAKKVYAVSSSGVLLKRGINTPDLFQATIEFENGALGSFESCWILPETMPSTVDFKLELLFTEASIFIDDQRGVIQKATRSQYSLPNVLWTDVYGQPVGFVAEAIRHFVNCVLEDRWPMPSGEDGLAVVKILAAIVESAEEGHPIMIH